MKLNSKNKLGLFLLLFFVKNFYAQETINANDPNNFVTGGGQEIQSFNLNILPVSIIDIEGFTGFNPGVDVNSLEAGKPVIGGITDLSNIWLNFSYRAVNMNTAKIYVSTNQPVPQGVTIKVEIDINNYGMDGDFIKNPRTDAVTLSQTEQVIINDFTNGYTGNGPGNGYRLIYTILNPNAISFPEGFEVLYKIQ